MVNKATGEAASASSHTVCSTGPGSLNDRAEATPPSKIAQGMGLPTTPRSAFRPATIMAWPPLSPGSASSCDRATHSELVITMSTTINTITGPAVWGPSKAASNGTPMKPVLGNAATSAPSEASFQRMRSLRLHTRANATMMSAQTK